MNNEIIVETGTILESLNNKVDLDGGNYKGSELEEYVHNHCATSILPNCVTTNNITNCITEIPQRIKLELADGVLTLKAGSEVIVPNGFEEDGTTLKFDYVTIENDVTETLGVTGTYERFLSYNPATKEMQVMFYGYTDAQTTVTGNYFNYVTSTNLIERYSGSIKDDYNYSLPLGIVQSTSGTISSIKKVFNGIGYIGSTIWVDKGVRGLIPNGRNEDGSLNNKEFTTENIILITITGSSTFDAPLIINDTNHLNTPAYSVRGLFYQDAQPTTAGSWYDTANNYWYYSTDGTNWVKQNIYLFLSTNVQFTNSKVTNLEAKQPFRALDYSDKPKISGWAMPSNKYIDLTLGASGTKYTAPANGWFSVYAQLSKETTTVAGYVGLYNETKHPIGGIVTGCFAGNSYKRIAIPCMKGDIVTVTYSNLTTYTPTFRFYYAEGEV